MANQETWDNDGKVSVDRKTWKELQPAQQRAANVLAIDKELWDKEVFVDVYERSWVELTKGVCVCVCVCVYSPYARALGTTVKI